MLNRQRDYRLNLLCPKVKRTCYLRNLHSNQNKPFLIKTNVTWIKSKSTTENTIHFFKMSERKLTCLLGCRWTPTPLKKVTTAKKRNLKCQQKEATYKKGHVLTALAKFKLDTTKNIHVSFTINVIHMSAIIECQNWVVRAINIAKSDFVPLTISCPRDWITVVVPI